MKAVCSFQRPLYTSVIYGRTIDQHTRDAYCDFGSGIPVISVTWIDRYCVGVCCERSHSSEQRPGSIRCRKTGRRDKTASFRQELSVAKGTLEIGRVRTRHFLIRLAPQHGGRVRTETMLRSKPPHRAPKRRQEACPTKSP